MWCGLVVSLGPWLQELVKNLDHFASLATVSLKDRKGAVLLWKLV